MTAMKQWRRQLDQVKATHLCEAIRNKGFYARIRLNEEVEFSKFVLSGRIYLAERQDKIGLRGRTLWSFVDSHEPLVGAWFGDVYTVNPRHILQTLLVCLGVGDGAAMHITPHHFPPELVSICGLVKAADPE